MRATRRYSAGLSVLRADRHLFALVGTLILVATYLQPLAEARAAGTPNAWVICSQFGVAKHPGAPAAGHAPGADDCPSCIAGLCKPPAPQGPPGVAGADGPVAVAGRDGVVRFPSHAPVAAPRRLIADGGIRAPPAG